MQEEFIQATPNSPRLHYRQAGHTSPTILFMHGWCIDSTYWEAQLAFLQSDFQVIALDMPGFGKSEKMDDAPTIPAFAATVLDFIAARNLEQVILVGHSMSGMIMLEMTLENHPAVIGGIGVDNFKLIDMPMSEEAKENMKAGMNAMKLDFETVALNNAENMLFSPTTSDEIRQRVKSAISGTEHAYGIATLQAFMDFTPQAPQKLQKFPFPLHLVNSDAIPTYLPGLDNNCANGYALYEVKGTGHYPMIEHPERFNELLHTAIREIIRAQ